MDILPTITTAMAAMAILLPCVVTGCEAGPDESYPPERISTPQRVDTDSEHLTELEVLAVVNDREITRQEVDDRLERLDELYRHSQRPFDDSLRSERRERVLQRLVDQELLREYVRDQDIQVPEDKVDRKLKHRKNTKFGSSDSFHRYLTARDVSASDYRREIRDKMAVEMTLEREAGVDRIDEEQLRQHYQRIAKRRPANERIHVELISIDFGDLPPAEAEDDPVRRKIRDRIQDVDDAQHLHELSSELESDFRIRHQKPRWVEASQLHRRSADILFDDDAPAEGVATVDRGSGIEIYWIYERREPGVRGFDEVEDLLRDRARRSLLESHRRQLLERLREEATITFYLPRQPETDHSDPP